MALLVALNLDAIHSLIIGCLSGMLAQRFSEQGAPFAALAIFVFAQIIAVYLPVTAVVILILNALLRRGLERWQIDTVASLSALVLLFVLREVIIRLIWHDLEQRLL